MCATSVTGSTSNQERQLWDHNEGLRSIDMRTKTSFKGYYICDYYYISLHLHQLIDIANLEIVFPINLRQRR